jgi:hypothetical protein
VPACSPTYNQLEPKLVPGDVINNAETRRDCDTVFMFKKCLL